MIIIDGAKECSLQLCLLILPSLSLLLAALSSCSCSAFLQLLGHLPGLSGLGFCGSILLLELLYNDLGGRFHLLQGFFGEDLPRSALHFLPLSHPILFGVALCRRLGLGQPAGLGQDP